jgi:hypothetical protein
MQQLSQLAGLPCRAVVHGVRQVSSEYGGLVLREQTCATTSSRTTQRSSMEGAWSAPSEYGGHACCSYRIRCMYRVCAVQRLRNPSFRKQLGNAGRQCPRAKREAGMLGTVLWVLAAAVQQQMCEA